MAIKILTRSEADRYIDALQEPADVGVTWSMVHPLHMTRAAYIDYVQWFGEEVVSRFW